jgi:hypothetical protein
LKRKIRLMVVKEKVPDIGEITLDYGEVMVDSLRAGGIQGLTVGEMKDRLDALDVIEPAREAEAEVVLLSEKEHATVKTAVSQYRFRWVLRSAVEFQEHIEHAPEVEEEECKEQ